MKIAQVNVYFKPFMVGGAEWYVYNISRELAKRGHDVHVFTANRYGKDTAPAEETMDGFRVHRLPLKADFSYRMKSWDGLVEALKAEKFDLIHTYDYAQPHSADAIRAGAESDARTVLTVFDVHSMIPRRKYKQVPMRVMEKYLAGKTLAKADRILVRAPNLVAPLLKLGAPRDKVVVTPSGVRDESLGVFDGPGFRERHSIAGSPVVLYMGRLNPLKGPQFLVEAAPKVLSASPGAEFVFVGPDQTGYSEELMSKASKLGVGSHMHILGPIYDFEEKMSAYSSCDVFALPTSFEGTSQSIFEAMAQGRPVVSTNVGGVPYQLTDGIEGRLVPYANVDALAGAITQITADRALANLMGSRGRERVQSQRYSVLTETLEGIYKEVRAE